MSPEPRLTIRLLGGFRLAIDGREVKKLTPQTATLIKVLALAPSHRVHIEQLAEAMWPERLPRDPVRALDVALNRARSGLRKGTGYQELPFLMRSANSIALGPQEQVLVDTDAFENAVADAWRVDDPATASAALMLYAGDLLPEDPYLEQAESPRARLRASSSSLRRRLAELFASQGELRRAIAALIQLVGDEPTDEEAQTALIRLYAETGQPRLALAQWEILNKVLDEELGVEPNRATFELIEQVRDGRFPSQIRLLEPPHVATGVQAVGMPPYVLADVDAAPRPESTSLRVGTSAKRQDDSFVTTPAVSRDSPVHQLAAVPALEEAIVGRDREIAEIRLMLTTTRLVSLTGPGGVGKTRLALAIAAALDEATGAQAAFVDLTSLRDETLVLPAIARSLGVRAERDLDLLGAVADALQTRQVLVLDGFEYVVAAANDVVELVRSCPGLRVLVTSRSRLRVKGEREYPVGPLELPRPTGPSTRRFQRQSFESLTQYAAIALFARRAVQARPGFSLDEENVESSIEVCRLLDGLPLAIELAAARIRILPPDELLRRLESPGSARLSLLIGSYQDVPERQRTLRATIEWSYELLTPAQQVLFQRFSVFASGGDLEAIAAIALDDAETDVVAAVADLVDQSLVHARWVPGTEGVQQTARFGMLESIREFATESLLASGEFNAIRTRHANYYADFVERVAPKVDQSDQRLWLELIELEQGNLRAALDWFLGRGQGTEALRVSGSMAKFWDMRGYWKEGEHWLERSLAITPGDQTLERARALLAAGAFAEAQGHLETALQRLEEARMVYEALGHAAGLCRVLNNTGIVLDLLGRLADAAANYEAALVHCREASENQGTGHALQNLGIIAARAGDFETAEAMLKSSMTLHRDLGDIHGESMALASLGSVAFRRNMLERALELGENALELAEGLDDRQGVARAHLALGETRQFLGEFDAALELYEQALALCRELGDDWGEAAATLGRGSVVFRRDGDAELASRLVREALFRFESIGDQEQIAACVEELAYHQIADKQPETAAQWLGIADALRKQIGIPLAPVYLMEHERAVASLRTSLKPLEFERWWPTDASPSIAPVIAGGREWRPSR
jgi:predicted ATPase/DNA-binding SARP family transcriptional activator